jgi:V/A-type H+-transporting ATPase subunit C
MIGEIISNSAINAKIHAKMRSNLKAEDYNCIVNMKSVAEIAEMLKNRPRFKRLFAGIDVRNIHRGQIEASLRRIIIEDIKSFLPFMGTSAKFFLRVYSIRNEIEYIKVIIRLLNSNEIDYMKRMTRFDGEFSSGVDFTALANAKSFDEFAEILKPTIYYMPLRSFAGNKTVSGNFEVEAALDRFYRSLTYSYMSRYLSKSDADTVEKILAVDTDLENLMFIIRAKLYYKMDKELICLYLSDKGRKLKSADIERLVSAKSDEELKKAVSETVYAELFFDGFDKAEDKIQRTKINYYRKAFKRRPYSTEAVLYYLKLCETEIKNITMATEGVRYGLDPKVIKGYLLNSENI